MSVLDRDGRITLWNDALERMLRCPPTGRSAGRSPTSCRRWRAPSCRGTIKADARGPQGRATLNHLRLPAGTETPHRAGQGAAGRRRRRAAVARRDRARRAPSTSSRRSGERLALAAEGANDGLWQWNLQTQEFYVSGRWRAMIGLPAHAAIGGSGEWLDRVHPDDVASLKAALEAHLAGSTPVFQHEHRIRHEDGAYRRFLCRGVAVRGRGTQARPDRRIADRHDGAGDRAGAAAQRRVPRFADRSVQPRRVRRGARAAARRVPAPRTRAAASRSSISISIGSRSSTTASATWSATSCWSRRRAGSRRACGRAMPWRGSAATSSRSSSTA